MVARIIALAIALAVSPSSGTLVASSKCYYHVKQQTLKVEKPELVEFAVEEQCPWDRYGDNHENICTQCAGVDNSCAGQFVACSGCCDLHKDQRIHQCANIKKYLTLKNSVVLDCDARTEWDDGEVNIEDGPETTSRENAGELESKCAVDEKIADDKGDMTPMKMKFDCTNCAEGNVPDLIEKCCLKARAYATGAEARKLEAQGAKPFVWAPGCEQSTLSSFSDLKEDKIDRDMEQYIERQYCSKAVQPGSDQCGNGYDRNRRLSSSNSSGNLSRNLQAKADCDWLQGDFVNAASSLSSFLPMAVVSHLVFLALV